MKKRDEATEKRGTCIYGCEIERNKKKDQEGNGETKKKEDGRKLGNKFLFLLSLCAPCVQFCLFAIRGQ